MWKDYQIGEQQMLDVNFQLDFVQIQVHQHQQLLNKLFRK